MTWEQEHSSLEEIKPTRNLLACRIRAIQTAKFIEKTIDPIFTMTSIGREERTGDRVTCPTTFSARRLKVPTATSDRHHGHRSKTPSSQNR